MRRISGSFLAVCFMVVAPMVLAQTGKAPPKQRDKAVFVNPAAPGESFKAVTRGRYCGPMRTSPDNPILGRYPVAGLWVYEDGPSSPSVQLAIPPSYLEALAKTLPAEDEQMKAAIGRVAKELTKAAEKINAGDIPTWDRLIDEETAGKITCFPLASLRSRDGFAPA
jgi:hypothetical protein